MTKKTVSRGVCEACNAVVAKSAMTRHLLACPAVAAAKATKAAGGKTTDLYTLVAEAPGMSDYWLTIEAPGSTTLAALDALLRDTWLECCGHLSAFEIGRMSYDSTGEDQGMDATIASVAATSPWKYEYDFGSTTRLRIRVSAPRKGANHGLRLLARNVAPEIACGSCGKVATQICTACLAEGDGVFCDACLKAHPCGEDETLPLVNSPRTGVCGYTG